MNLCFFCFSEKKNERKAAKTLSAILLAFVVTWTPYSVLTVANAFLGKESADKYIPGVVWDFSYYLCYINSTVNPVLYALCNAAFRRTYVRILTCRWAGRSRQAYGNRYYYGWTSYFLYSLNVVLEWNISRSYIASIFFIIIIIYFTVNR